METTHLIFAAMIIGFIDTGFKFPEMYALIDALCGKIAAELMVERNED